MNKVAENNQQTQPQVKYTTTADPVSDVYSDGIFGITLRNGMATVETYRVLGIEEQTKAEIRRVNHRLVLPQVGLNELAAILQRMAQAIRDAQQQQQGGADKGNPITT